MKCAICIFQGGPPDPNVALEAVTIMEGYAVCAVHMIWMAQRHSQFDFMTVRSNFSGEESNAQR